MLRIDCDGEHRVGNQIRVVHAVWCRKGECIDTQTRNSGAVFSADPELRAIIGHVILNVEYVIVRQRLFVAGLTEDLPVIAIKSAESVIRAKPDVSVSIDTHGLYLIRG